MVTNSNPQTSLSTQNPVSSWAIVGVDPAEGVYTLMRDQADDYLTSYRTDLDVRDREMLFSAQKGEFIWVLRPSGTDLFCRSLLTDSRKLHFAALWLAAVGQDSKARFFAGRLGNHGGLIRKISREEAIERMGRWVFFAAGR
ncbi:hypothetical protein ACHHRT_12710 [Desulfurivibrio sp. D14AmB]|uniref:hypothetical protein n=1 Tax=Desulfurivibrio sp. D14AmB TaxID=3374370 RepID=UPI00376F43FD